MDSYPSTEANFFPVFRTVVIDMIYCEETFLRLPTTDTCIAAVRSENCVFDSLAVLFHLEFLFLTMFVIPLTIRFANFS